MTNRFWTLVAVVFGLFLVGMASLKGAVILLALPLLAYLAWSARSAPWGAKLEAQRTLNTHVVKADQPLQVRLEITSAGAEIAECFVEDDLPEEALCAGGSPRGLRSLGEGESFELAYTLQSSRGRYNLEGLQARLGDHFGLLQQVIRFSAVDELRTAPRVPNLRSVRIRPSHTRGFSGPIPARLSGSGMIFWGVREFHLGDTLRQVNWKVSSRHTDALYTNEFEMERIADVGLILDARAQVDITVRDERLFEYSVSALAALAGAFLADGHRVSMLSYGYGIQRVYPGYGRVQRARILQALAEVEPGSNYALENFNHLPTRLFPARSQLVMVSPLHPRDYSTYVRLRRDGYEVMLVSPNPVEFEVRLYPASPMLEQARRMAQLERDLWLRRLVRLGVQVVDWQVDQPIEKVIHSMLDRQPLVRRNTQMMVKP